MPPNRGAPADDGQHDVSNTGAREGRRGRSTQSAARGSLSLRMPRSSSVQQLVQQWEVGATPTTAAAASSPQKERTNAAARSPASPRVESRDNGLKAQPTNAVIHATVGKMDWTPKYGLGMHMDGDAPARRSAPERAEARTSPRASTKSAGTTGQSSSAPEDRRAAKKSGSPGVQLKAGREPPSIPLKSVQPETSLPSPVSPPSASTDSKMSGFFPSTGACGPPRPSVGSGVPATSPVQPTGVASKPFSTSAGEQKTSSESTAASVLQASEAPSSPDCPVYVRVEAVRPSRLVGSVVASSVRSAEVPVEARPASRERRQAAPPTIEPPVLVNESLRGATLRPRDGLARTSDGTDIFDLEGKSGKSRTSWLPSVFLSEPASHEATEGVRPAVRLSATGLTDAQPGSSSDGDPLMRGQDQASVPRTSLDTLCSMRPGPGLSSRSTSTLVPREGSPSPASTEPSRYSAVCHSYDQAEGLPVPADEVFAAAAPPLHLPALDEYLANGVLFAKPTFSDAVAICTQEERELFGFHKGLEAFDAADNGGSNFSSRFGVKPAAGQTKRRSPVLEVAGGQMNLPQGAFASATEMGGGSARQRPGGLRQRLVGKYTKVDIGDGDELEAIVTALNKTGDALYSDGSESDDGKTVLASDEGISLSNDSLDKRRAATAAVDSDVAHADYLKRPRMPPPADSDLSLPVPSAVPSQMSTASRPVTRLQMFPPLMLLKENSLDELKSNAIGPRKPPGGIGDIQILGTIFDFIIGAEGSNFAAGLFRLELLRDFVQLMAASLHFESFASGTLTTSDKARKFLLQTLPSLLGLNLVSVFGYAVIFFLTWICITALALWRFWMMTRTYDPNRNVEGFDSQGYVYKASSRSSKLLNTTIVFLLSTLYLPLSKLAVNALVWSSDFWPVANPYAGGVDDPALVALGDEDIWRQPTEFCYTTTMRKDGYNWAYVIVPLAAATFLFYTLWFPWRMMMTIRDMLPSVSPYNELGKKRTDEEMEIEYCRLLQRDKSPLNFLYNAYRRKWGFYKPMYIILFKFSNLVIIGVLAKDTCLFRSYPTKTMLAIQQITLIVVMSFLLGLHLYIKPFVDQISNRSEMVSRIGYVCTAVIGLLVTLNVQGSTVYNTVVLYGIQAISYTGNIYFAIIGTSLAAYSVKRWQKRVDFSIDVFSPLLDLQKHIKRRVWQETLSTILLSGRGLHMPLDQVIAFSMSESDVRPPYLLDFRGSAAERHIENLKIVKQIGIEEYERQVRRSRTAEGARLRELVRSIQHTYAGPDAYYRPMHPPFPSGVLSFFGKAFVVPFPPTIVMRYDQGSKRTLQITSLEDFEAFVWQNASEEVRSRKMVRQALRALEGQRVLCPHVDNVPYGRGSHGPAWLSKLSARLGGERRRYTHAPAHVNDFTMVTPVSYVEGTLRIERRVEHEWNGYNFSSGFYVKLVYDQGGRRQESNGAITTVREVLEVSGSRAFGLPDDFVMTPSLARFLKDNECAVKERLPYVEAILQRYRKDFEREARRKEREMPYSFETDIFNNHHLSLDELHATLRRTVKSKALAQLPLRYRGCITMLYERLVAIDRSPVHRYWWLLFDELWRMNNGDYKLLSQHRRSFSPQFATSIAYMPMPRADLERYLRKRGLWKKGGETGGPFNRGLLNRIYFYLNEVVFAGHHSGHSTLTSLHSRSGNGVIGGNGDKGGGGPRRGPDGSRPADVGRGLISIGFGTTPQNATRRDYPSFEDLKDPTDAPPRHGGGGGGRDDPSSHSDSRLTGGGTAYSTVNIQDRSAYAWEQRMDGRPLSTRLQRLKIKTLQWLSLSPFVLDFDRERLFLYVQLVDDDGGVASNGRGKRYVLLPDRGAGRC